MRLLTQLTYLDVVAKTGSIRKAAEQLNITSTALNRRILAFEEELGTPIFERLPQGVRLNVAGEMVIQHIRRSMADLSKVTSQIADLQGYRSGHVKIAGGSEVVGGFLPRHIAHYRQQHQAVTFEILRRTPELALSALQDYEADLSLIFGAVPPTEFQILATVELPVMLACATSHPLALNEELRLYDCQPYPAIMPAPGSGLYDLLYHAEKRKGIQLNHMITSESFEFMARYSAFEDAITFVLPFHDDQNERLAFLPFKANEAMTGRLHLVQTKGRVLPVAAAKFAEDIIQYFNNAFPNATN